MKKLFFILLMANLSLNSAIVHNASISEQWAQCEKQASFAKKYPEIKKLIPQIEEWSNSKPSLTKSLWGELKGFFLRHLEKITPTIKEELEALQNDSDLDTIITDQTIGSYGDYALIKDIIRDILRKKAAENKQDDKKEKEEKEAAEVPYALLSQKEKADIDSFNARYKEYEAQYALLDAEEAAAAAGGGAERFNIWPIHQKKVELHSKFFPNRYELKADPKIEHALLGGKKHQPSYCINFFMGIHHADLTLAKLAQLGWQKSPQNRFKPNELIVKKYIDSQSQESSFRLCLVKYKTAHGYEIECYNTLKIVKPEHLFKYGKDGIFALYEHDWNIANNIEQKRIMYEKTPLYHLNTYIPNFEQEWAKGTQADRIAQFERALTLAAANKDAAQVQRAYDFLELFELVLKNTDFLADKQLQYLKDDLKGKILAAQFEQALLAADKEKIKEFGDKVQAFAVNYLAQKHPDAAVKEKLQAVLAQYEKSQRGSFAKKYPLIAQRVKEMKKWALQNKATQKMLEDPTTTPEDRNTIFWDELEQFLAKNPDKVTEAVEAELNDLQKESMIDESAKEFIQGMLDSAEKYKKQTATWKVNMFQGAMAKKYPLIAQLIPEIKAYGLSLPETYKAIKNPNTTDEDRNMFFWDALSQFLTSEKVTDGIKAELHQLYVDPVLDELGKSALDIIFKDLQK